MANPRSGPRFLSPCLSLPTAQKLSAGEDAKKPELTARATTHSPSALQPSPCLEGGTCSVTSASARRRTHGGLLADSDLLLSLSLETGQLWVGGVRGDHLGPAVNTRRGSPFHLAQLPTKSTPMSVYICAAPRGVEGSQTDRDIRSRGQAWTRTPFPRSQPALAGWAQPYSHREAHFLSSG